MVFFTCGNCGDSLKKNKVEKHYQTVCSRKPVALTCVDCCKDFSAETYPAHTKCISEEEKYSAKGFVPRPSANKGELKQQKWQEIIQSVRETHRNSLSREEKIILDTIAKHENVPRKKNKFQNFLRSMMKNRYNAQAADNVFDKIEAENKQNTNEQGGSDRQNESMKEDEKENTASEEIKENGDNIEHDHGEEKLSKKEKKEKRKREKYEAELKEIENNQIAKVEEDINSEPKKKKKKNKKEITELDSENGNEVEVSENGISGDIEMTEGKKLKKKHRKNKEVTENILTGNNEMTKGKKYKKKHGKDNNIAENEVPESNDLVVEKKSKKKRKKEQETSVEEEPAKKKARESAGEEEDITVGKVKFNWQEIIMKVLDSKDGKEMPLKRLRKRVLTEFEATGNGSATSVKTLAKFNKKVHHTPGVVVLKDIAKLVNAN